MGFYHQHSSTEYALVLYKVFSTLWIKKKPGGGWH